MRKSIVYINANNFRKEFFLNIQRVKIERDRSSNETKTLFNDERKRLTRQRFLKLFQNVKTRWDFTCHMLIRAYNLREDLNQFFQDYSSKYLQFKVEEWDHVKYLIDIVKSFCVFIKTFSTTIISTIYQMFSIYNSLFDHLNKVKNHLQRKRVLWKKELINAIDVADTKLWEYYIRTQEDLRYLYDKAILLCSLTEDTQFKSRNWQTKKRETFFRDIYWDELKANYENYQRTSSYNNASSSQQQRFNRESQSLDALLKKESNNRVESFDDEFERYKDQNMFHEFY